MCGNLGESRLRIRNNSVACLCALAFLMFAEAGSPSSGSAPGKEFNVVSLSQDGGANLRTSQRSADDPRLIKAGLSVGLVKLGDSVDQALAALHAKPEDLYDLGLSDCGGHWFIWTDVEGTKGRGNVYFFIKDGRIYQIDSATPRFRTIDGVSSHSPPSEVKRRYRELHAFVLSNTTSEALGGRPLTYWIDRAKGIAFAFAYYPRQNTRYLYSIIVFNPDSEVCPFGGTVNPDEKHELAPYTVELPKSIPE